MIVHPLPHQVTVTGTKTRVRRGLMWRGAGLYVTFAPVSRGHGNREAREEANMRLFSTTPKKQKKEAKIAMIRYQTCTGTKIFKRRKKIYFLMRLKFL